MRFKFVTRELYRKKKGKAFIENLKLEEVCPPKKSGKGVTKEEVRRAEELYSKLSNYFRKDLKGFLGA